MKKLVSVAVLCIILGTCASAQSRNFKLGQWTEIQNAILKELNASYVDSLPLDRIERAGIDAMLESLDPYTIYIPDEEQEDLEMMLSKSYGGFGALIYKPDIDGNVIITEPYRDSPAHRLGFVCGDEIVAIDGVTVKGLTAAECTAKMKGKPGTTVVFTTKHLRTGVTDDVTVKRERIHLPDVEYYGMVDDSTGYISQTGFTANVSGEVRSAVLDLKKQGAKRLVLDLRGNGGGLLEEAVNIVSLFVPRGSLIVTRKGKEDSGSYEYRTNTEPIDTRIPIIVLTDSGTASSSEIVSGAIQDLDRGTIMGTRTFGKGLVQSLRPLPYNGSLKVTTAKYYTPSGRCVQAIDYSHRNEDGSVGHIADSLTHEFRTSRGRIVRDGGGITPDVIIEGKDYSRLTYSLVVNGVVEHFALDFVRRNSSIAPIDEFCLSEEEYENFIKFAVNETFDYRSSARTLFDQMRKELGREGLDAAMEKELEALGNALDMDKETFLRLKKNEIVPFLEEEIAVRYYFQEAGVKVRLRYDEQLHKALRSPLAVSGGE